MLLFWFLGVRPRIRRHAGNEFIPPECGFEEFESLVNWYKFNVFSVNFVNLVQIHIQPMQRFVFMAIYIVLALGKSGVSFCWRLSIYCRKSR